MPDTNNSFSRGSEWRKCDLHIHTPKSVVQHYGADTDEVWERFITDIENSYPDGSMIGISDYYFLDGYEKVLEYKNHGRLANISKIFPVIEIRLKEFGGSRHELNRVNAHIIFNPDVCSVDLIKNQFFPELTSKYQVSDKCASNNITWNGTISKEGLSELGRQIKSTVPETEENKYESDFIEGFNNLNIQLSDVKKAMNKTFFERATLLVIGKTEWGQIRWSGTVADKKHILQSADFIFNSYNEVDKAVLDSQKLRENNVQSRILDCSDAHNFSNSSDREPNCLGKCCTWLKGAPCFETLRQAIFSYDTRVRISKEKPVNALSYFDSAKIEMPEDVKIGKEVHCFSGMNRILYFNPGLNCLIGGRGTGKSLLLSMISNKNTDNVSGMGEVLNNITPKNWKDYIGVDDIPFEYFGQGTIEDLYKDKDKFNNTVMDRLYRYWENTTYDNCEPAVQGVNGVATENSRVSYQDEINTKKTDLVKLLCNVRKNIEDINICIQNDIQIKKLGTQLANKKKIIDAFDDDNYKKMREDLNTINTKVHFIDESKEKLEALMIALKNIFSSQQIISTEATNSDVFYYAKRYNKLIELWGQLREHFKKEDNNSEFNVVETQLKTQFTNCKKQLVDYFKEKGLDTISIADATKAHTEVAVLQEEISKLRKFNSDHVIDFNKTKSELESANILYLEKLNEIINRTNMDLARDGNEEKKLLSFGVEYDKEKAHAELCRFLKDTVDINPNDFQSLINRRKEETDLFSNGMEELCKNNDDLSTARKILEFFNSNDRNMQLYDMHVLLSQNNWVEYAKFSLKYKGKDLNELSFGQRATAVVIMLLLFDNKPIIIDEPETHLDQRFIANELVDIIKQVKQNRQIIFATHNANIVVGADAEQIYVLKTDERTKLTSFEQMSIEDVYEKNKQAELMCLEGSKEAFQNREKKYSL